MSRIHDDRKDMYNREGVLTSASNIRSIHTISQNMEKEKIEKSSFAPHSYGVNESGFRTIDLLKHKPPQGRNIVPASLGSTQLHAMPPLLPNYISGSGLLTNVPMNHSLVRGSLPAGQHAFQTHIPVGIGGGTAIPPPRGSVTMSQRSLPSLKPTNLSNQIQLPLNQIPGLPTILPPSVTSSRTGSPIVSSHNLQNDNRVDSRNSMLSDPHAIRGNIQAPGQHGTQATIQVIASGTAVQQPHIPASFLSKGMNLNATSNMLKIGVTSHSNASPGTGISGSAFKLGIGKAYPGSSSIIISGTTSISKPDIMDGRHNVVGPPAYNRFPTVCLPNHHIQSHTVSTPITAIQTSSIASEPRPHAVGVPYHSISGAYVFHDMGHSIGIHNFPHLIRPPSTSVGSLPMFPVDSQRGLPTVPVVAVSSKGNVQLSESHDISRSDGLTIHGGTSFNIQNLYPNLQSSSFPSTFSSATNTIESSVRPSILRKRPTETPTMFPVQPSEKERISSPIKQENMLNMVIPSRILSPPHTSEKVDISKPTNHSILSITSDLKNGGNVTEAPTTIVYSTLSKLTAPTNLLTNSFTNNLVNNSVAEASPKKKPRKQLIITTEDKYGTVTPINSCATDEDEEFLKANETMKDITPPKLTPSQPLLSTATSHHKQLFSSTLETSTAVNSIHEHKDLHLNGLITVTSECHSTEPVKYYIFRRRPQVSILSEYKINSKAAHNHFYRYSDIKVKDEKKSLSHDKFLNKSSLESSTGWRLHQLSTQFEDLVQVEAELCADILLYKEAIPSPSVSSPNFESDSKLSSEDSQLRLLHDLLQGNIQRCRHSIEQLEDAKKTMFHLLEHKQKYLEIRKQRKDKTKIKKKGVS